MNDYRAYVECDYNSIYHHGIKGQKWGVRRYQNEDGTRTEAGKKRYGNFHIHVDPVSWVAGIASRNSGERLTSIKVAGDKDNGDSLFIDSLLFIPYNVAKRSINNGRERKRLMMSSDPIMKAGGRDSKNVRQAKKDWVDLTDSEFRKKYYMSKENYYGRVKKGEADWIAPKGYSEEKKYND